MAVAANFDAVQKLYIAFYQRPADPAGLRYWADRVEVAGGDTSAVINAFASSAEATALYGEITEANIGDAVTKIYQALFGRAPDAAGLEYYKEAFANGELSAGTIALQILDGASGDDTIALNNKMAVAKEFTEQVAGQKLTDANFGQGGNFAVTYDAEDAEAAREILAGVTAAPSTVLDANAVRDVLREQIANAGDEIQRPDAGNTFAFTDKVGELITGTTGNDTITGVIGNGSTGTLQFGDQVNGGAGQDVLNLFTLGTGTSLPAGVSISGVETINLDQTQGVVSSLSAASFQGATQIWQINQATAITGVGATTTAGFRQTGQDATVTFTGAEGSIAFDKISDGEAFTVANATVGSLKTVDVSGSVAGNGGVTLLTDAASTDVSTLNLSLSTNGSVTVSSFSELETLDASGSTGSLNLGTLTLAKNAAVTLGSGNDTITLTATGTAAFTVDSGAGNDTITTGANADTVKGGAGNDIIVTNDGNDIIDGGEGNDIITGGKGADQITLGAGKDVVKYTNVNESQFAAGNNVTMDIIADFTSGEDKISLSGTGLSGVVSVLEQIAVGTAVSNLAATATLADAINAATRVADFDANELSWFEFKGNTYVVGAGASDTLATDDFVIELTGSVELAASDFIFA